jgi:hypothetical protein
LKSELLELKRQSHEIDFIKTSLENNSEKQSAINFLRISQGHEAYKIDILQRKANVSEIQINLSLNGKVNVNSDQSIKNLDIGQLNPEKQNVIDKTKQQII